MITTTTTTTATAISSGAIASFALLGIVALVALLIAKEVSGSLQGERARRLSQSLNIAIVPLTLLFVSTLIFRILDVLR